MCLGPKRIVSFRLLTGGSGRFEKESVHANRISSMELTYSTLGKGKQFSKVPPDGIC